MSPALEDVPTPRQEPTDIKKWQGSCTSPTAGTKMIS
jgi:hypothetical protein